MSRSSLVTIVASACLVAATAATAGSLAFVRTYSLQGDFVDDDGNVATDLSGLACTALPARYCLAVNDENQTAQFATIEDGRIRPQATIPLIGPQPSAATVGTAPAVTTCPAGAKKYKEFDGEAVAYAAPYFYVVGSHGCGRNNQAFRLSSFMLARIRVDSHARPVDAQGQPLSAAAAGQAVETTYRLADVLQRASDVRAFFGTGLDEASNGLNIEGLAVAGGKLFVGLRAPSMQGQAYILGVALADLFAAGPAPSVAEPEVMAVELGPPTAKLGIRDLAPFQDQLLLLAGPAQEQDDVAYSLFLVEPRAGAKPTPVASIPDLIQDGKRMKAESVTILDARDDTLHVLIMFDGPRNGAPHEYRVSLK
jgi:Protein of unknown function (DUF3616)